VKADGDPSLLVHAGAPCTTVAAAPPTTACAADASTVRHDGDAAPTGARGSLTVQPADEAFDGQFFYRIGWHPCLGRAGWTACSSTFLPCATPAGAYGALAYVFSAGDPDLVPWSLIGLTSWPWWRWRASVARWPARAAVTRPGACSSRCGPVRLLPVARHLGARGVGVPARRASSRSDIASGVGPGCCSPPRPSRATRRWSCRSCAARRRLDLVDHAHPRAGPSRAGLDRTARSDRSRRRLAPTRPGGVGRSDRGGLDPVVRLRHLAARAAGPVGPCR